MAARHILPSLLFAANLTGSQAQLTSSYKDPSTGITFQRITQDAGYSFGIAVPEEPSTDFIGQISATMTAGWAGVSLTGQMVNSLLVAAVRQSPVKDGNDEFIYLPYLTSSEQFALPAQPHTARVVELR